MQIDPTNIITFTLALSIIFALLSAALVIVLIQLKKLSAQEHWSKGMIGEYERYLEELSSILHNNVQQQLTYLSQLTNGKQTNIGSTVHLDLPQIKRTIKELNEILSRIHKSMNLDFLRSQSLSRLIEAELRIAKSSSAIIDYKVDCLYEPELNFRTKLLLYRIAQEAISNISRHALASSITVSIKWKQKNLVLQIDDNGLGFDEYKIYGAPTFGLANMRKRAAMLNAKLSINSEHELGTTVTVELSNFL